MRTVSELPRDGVVETGANHLSSSGANDPHWRRETEKVLEKFGDRPPIVSPPPVRNYNLGGFPNGLTADKSRLAVAIQSDSSLSPSVSFAHPFLL